MKYKIQISKAKLIVLVGVCFFIAYLAYNSGPNPNYQLKLETSAPQEYWSFFSEGARKKLSVIQTITLKFQNPIANFRFDDKKYFIEVFKLDALADKPLDELIASSSNTDFMNNGITYLESGGPLFDVSFKTGKNKARHININLKGNNTHQIRNDSVAYFNSDFYFFAINYNKSDTTAIWATTGGRPPEIPTLALPIDILFIKKHGAIYLLIMSVNDSKTSLPANKLYDLVCRK
ncbi:hypothetical protein [Mucilaginibacter sp.]|jgi:hypothetical protein|uniref:hypothetical protein n=1 Tax=Mucilaginibacter sp. TaxID=1882438 RepID=UPI002C0EC3E7|nr:hypothetical protein [Mucilaginibacter sp.]HTI61085.1 hypothetical protein [Mucilaginibacter sp.]